MKNFCDFYASFGKKTEWRKKSLLCIALSFGTCYNIELEKKIVKKIT